MSEYEETLLEQLRRHHIVDPNDEEEMENLKDDLQAAISYAAGAGVPETEDPLRALLIRKLAGYWYECRGPDTRTNTYPDPPPDLNALVLQLRSAPEVST